MNNNIEREETLRANIYVHSSLVNSGEYQKSPHFLPENKNNVTKTLNRLVEQLDDKTRRRSVDFGCGTGFMIQLMQDMFDEVHGVDITTDMMRHVDLSSGNIQLHECLAESTPFESDYFDFATAYSFMDHLYDYKEFLKEAYRVLKPGGIFYADLNPNKDFIEAMIRADTTRTTNLSEIVTKEIKGALHNGEFYEEKFGINGVALDAAEPVKSKNKGFDASDTINTARELGFSVCNVEHQWFIWPGKSDPQHTFGRRSCNR